MGPRSGIARGPGRLRALFDHIEADDAQRNSPARRGGSAARSAAGVHRPSDRSRAPFRAHQAATRRRNCSTNRRIRVRPRWDRGAHPAAPCGGPSTWSGRPTNCASTAPTPVDEARAAIYYLQELLRGVSGDLFDELDTQLARVGVELPAHARPLNFGSWVGGDRDGNPLVTAEVTTAVLELQHDRALVELVRAVDELSAQLSSSEHIHGRVGGVGRQPAARRGGAAGHRPRGAVSATRTRAIGSSWRSSGAGSRTRAGASPSTPATCRATTT